MVNASALAVVSYPARMSTYACHPSKEGSTCHECYGVPCHDVSSMLWPGGCRGTAQHAAHGRHLASDSRAGSAGEAAPGHVAAGAYEHAQGS